MLRSSEEIVDICMNQLIYLFVKANQSIIITNVEGTIASNTLCGSLPLIIVGKATKVRNDKNIAFRMVLERK